MSGSYGTVGGGRKNRAEGTSATVSGGFDNRAASSTATVVGGWENTAWAGAFVGGGRTNTASGQGSAVVGGLRNSAAGYQAMVPGGVDNTAAGEQSLAAGLRAKANHVGTFVWADSSTYTSDFASSAANEFSVRATGGVRFVTAIDTDPNNATPDGTPTAGVTLPSGAGSWSTLSDRAAKRDFAPVNAQSLLNRLARLPVTTWNYKTQQRSIRHIGPTAQDFANAFHVGEDSRRIATVDADGVALAAIQALNARLERTNTRLATANAAHQRQIRQLRAAVAKLSHERR